MTHTRFSTCPHHHHHHYYYYCYYYSPSPGVTYDIGAEELAITSPKVIIGNPVAFPLIDGSGSERVFHVLAGEEEGGGERRRRRRSSCSSSSNSSSSNHPLLLLLFLLPPPPPSSQVVLSISAL